MHNVLQLFLVYTYKTYIFTIKVFEKKIVSGDAFYMDKGSNQKLQMLSNKCKHICKKYAGEIKGRGTIHTKLEGEIKAPSETLTLQPVH